MKDRHRALRRHHRRRMIARREWTWRHIRIYDGFRGGYLAKGNRTCSCTWCKGFKRLERKRRRMRLKVDRFSEE
ncbi:MAG TPA: hypothetical protein VNT75_32290 [Symbiobacteriaceae bacterium]|nr:hypothetical protein [Symbiobacteriaceae bacterium]